MKKLVLMVAMVAASFSAMAQQLGSLNLSKADSINYLLMSACQMDGLTFSTYAADVGVKFQEPIVGAFYENGKIRQFDSDMQAINYVSKFGWRLIHQNIVSDKYSITRKYLFERK
jgi:hypothetical protein